MNELPVDLMTPAEVCKLLPSFHAGKRLNVATVHRWIARGWLRAYRLRGPAKTMRYVSRADVAAMLVVETPAQPPRPPTHRTRDARTEAALARHGLPYG